MKKLITVMAAMLLTAVLFAQNAKSTGLTDSDVKNWTKNCVAIDNEFAKKGLDREGNDMSAKDLAVAESILQKYGISGPKSVEKYAMILQSAAVVKAESELDAEAKAMIKMLGIDPLAELKKNLNAADYKIVAANAKAVTKAVDSLQSNVALAATASSDNAGEEYMQQIMNERDAYVISLIQPQIDEENEVYEPVKRFYDAISKSKGDCGLIYKTRESDRASEYAKGKNTAASQTYSLECEGDAQITVNVDFKKNTIVFNILWKEITADPKYDEFRKTTDVKKTVKFSIKSVDFYTAGRESYTDVRSEYAITTKEGNVIHIWKYLSFDGNAYESYISFKGMPEEFKDCMVFTLDD